MSKNSLVMRGSISFLLIFAILLSCDPALAQGPDLVPVSDITGGSSIFVFRNTSRPTRKFAAARSTRTKIQRLETAKKIKKQYDTLAQTAPRRVKAAVQTPDKIAVNIKTMSSEKASMLFAGVGEYYLDRNDTENALNVFKEAVELNAKNAKAKEGLSDALAAKGNDLLFKEQSAQAKAYFLEAIKNDTKNAQAYFGLGEVFTDLSQDKDAISNYEKALTNDTGLTEIYVPLGILYYQAGEIAKADDLLTKALASSSETAETQLFLGTIRLSQNRNQEALKAFQRAKAIEPNMPEAFYQTGETYVRLGREKDAVAEYQKAVAIKANYFDAWLSLGDTLYDLKNYTEAIAAYKAAGKLKNDSAAVLVGLGDAQRMDERFDEAAGSYNLAATFLTRVPTYNKDEVAELYSKVGYSIGQQCQKNMKANIACQWPQAIKSLEKAVELGGGNAADFANLGWAYYNAARGDGFKKLEVEKRAKLELAKTNLQKAVAANPSYIEGPLLNLGMVLTDLGDYPGAVDALTKVTQKEPKWVFALNELGIAYRQQKNYKDAIAQFKKAVDKDDTFAAAHYNLGEAEFRNGNTGNAKKEYQKLKNLGRNDLALQLELISNGAVRK